MLLDDDEGNQQLFINWKLDCFELIIFLSNYIHFLIFILSKSKYSFENESTDSIASHKAQRDNKK